MRIGHGYDVHRFGAREEGTGSIRLAGIDVPCDRPVVAHSDGDVLVHALCDALLGAAGLGDIGRHFPDDDARFAGADSMTLLADVMAQLQARSLRVSNADLTLVAQTPRVAAHVGAMGERVAAGLGVDPSRVNVKATTTEKLDAIGAGEGLAAHAVVLLLEAADGGA
ncbi:MAG TPA: 2-C-methyl-D-erythritol 2,4-cyclodiphosphate synthase [Pseudomonadales bacterium]|nr:2-C-methyl-D-erythritol 2,4-cyclodiphosphate synthase [Pseudomonadales bacterium]